MIKASLIHKLSSLILFFLFRGLRVLSVHDSRVRQEMEAWPQGLSVKLVCGGRGPVLSMTWTGSRGLVRQRHNCPADITMVFKTPERALLVLTGLCGISQAYAGHYFSLEGDIHMAMGFVRCVEIAEAYLFPRFMSHRILRRVPEKQMPALLVYGMILLGWT